MMCLSCYAGYGFPKIVNPATKRLVELSNRVYDFSLVGGNLHCELDDWNLDDEFFEGDELGIYGEAPPPDQLEVERECYAAMKAMTLEERAAGLALRDGFLREDGTLDPQIDEAAWRAQAEEEAQEHS